MAHEAVTGSRFVCKRKYPDDPKREVFEAAKSGDAVLLDEVLVQMNASERSSALALETRRGKFHCCTPLMVAVEHGNLACVKVLLKYIADIEIRGHENNDGNTVRSVDRMLMMTCQFYHIHVSVEIVGCLVEHGAKVDFQDNEGRTPLMQASMNGHMNLVRFLVEHGAEVDFRQGRQGHTPLMAASLYGHINVVKCLVELGANVDLQTKDGFTPLLIASQCHRVNVVKCLVEHGANMDHQDEDGCTPLMLGSRPRRNGDMNVHIVKFLIKHGANINLLDKNNKTALHYAVQSDNASFDVLSCLITNGADVNACTNDYRTPLMLASRYGLKNGVSYLVKHGANMDLQDEEGKTALMLAIESDHMKVVMFLVQHGANVNLQDKEGHTLLMSASRKQSVNTVTFLIKQGADIYLQDEKGETALHCSVGNFGVMKWLIKNGADVNVLTNFNCTPLMFASYNGRIDAVRYLIKHGANLDLQDNNGNTALHHAVNGCNLIDVVHELLTHRASQMHNNQRLTPLLLASNRSMVSLVEFLIKRPECTKKQRIDALELLAATLATGKVLSGRIDTEEAFEYITQGMTERFEDPSHPLLKQPMEPIEAYQNRKESQTLEELAQIKGDRDAIIMEGLIIRERILGTDNTELLDPIRDVADCFNFPICIGLLRHAMKIAQLCNQSVILDLDLLTVLQKKDWRDISPRQKDLVIELLEQTVLEYEKDQKPEPRGLFDSLIKLMQIIASFKHFEECQASRLSVLLQKLSHLNPRDDSGNTLLHLSVYHRNMWFNGVHIHEYMNSKCPSIDTVKHLVNAGFNVNAINNNGHNPLHIIVIFKPKNDAEFHLLTDMLEVLLDGGAHHDFVDCDGKTAMDLAQTDEARMILSDKRKLELKCISARAVKKFGLAYLGMVPKTLEKYISMH